MKKIIMIVAFIVSFVWINPAVIAAGRDVELLWDHSIDEPYIETYRVYFGQTKGGDLPYQSDTGKVTQYVVEALPDGQWCFALTAIDTRGLESIRTPEICTMLYEGPGPPIKVRFGSIIRNLLKALFGK